MSILPSNDTILKRLKKEYPNVGGSVSLSDSGFSKYSNSALPSNEAILNRLKSDPSKYGNLSIDFSLPSTQAKTITSEQSDVAKDVKVPLAQRVSTLMKNLSVGIFGEKNGKPIDDPKILESAKLAKVQVEKNRTNIISDYIGWLQSGIKDDSVKKALVMQLTPDNFSQVQDEVKQISPDDFNVTGTYESGMGLFKKTRNKTTYDYAKSKTFWNDLKTLEKTEEDLDQVLGKTVANKGFIRSFYDSIRDFDEYFPASAEYGNYILPTQRAKTQAFEKLKKGEDLTESDWVNLNSLEAEKLNNFVDKGLGTRVGEGLTASLGFVAEMYAMSAMMGGEPVSAQTASTLVSKIPSKTLQKVTSKLLSNSVNMAVKSQVDIPMIEAKTAEYMLPTADYERWLAENGGSESILDYMQQGDDPLKAEQKARQAAAVEYISEGVGDYIDDGARFVKKAFLGKWLEKKGIKTTGQLLDILSQVHINSVISEMIEEEVGEPFTAKIEDRDYYNPITTPEGRERLLTSFLTISPLRGMSKVSEGTMNGVRAFREKNKTKIGFGESDAESKAVVRARENYQPEGLPEQAIGSLVSIRPDGTASYNIEILEEARGTGIGTNVVSIIEQSIADRGVSEIVLPVKNESIGFFEKQGYKVGDAMSSGITRMTKTLDLAETAKNAVETSETEVIKPVEVSPFDVAKATPESVSEIKVEKQKLYHGSDGAVNEEIKSFDNALEIKGYQLQLLEEMAAQGSLEAQKILDNKTGSKIDFVSADNLIRETFGKIYDAIKYTNEGGREAVGNEYHDLATNRFYAENEATAKVYSKQRGRDIKYKESTNKVIERLPELERVSEEQIKVSKNIKDVKKTLGNIRAELEQLTVEAESLAIIAQEKRSGIDTKDVATLKRIYARSKKFQEGDIETIRSHSDSSASLVNRVIENIQEVHPNFSEQEAFDFALDLPTLSDELPRNADISYLKKQEKKLSKYLELLKQKQEELNLKEDDALYKEWVNTLAVQENLHKVIKVPPTQIPVGQGKEKVSRLEARMRGKLDDIKNMNIEKIKEEFGLVTYNQMNRDEQIALASEFVSSYPDEAMQVLKGEKNPPEGLLINSIYVAMKELGTSDTELATRLVSLSATRAGQEINILSMLDESNPVSMMEDVVRTRIEAFEKRTGKKAQKKIAEEVNKINAEQKVSDTQQWDAFLAEIRC